MTDDTSDADLSLGPVNPNEILVATAHLDLVRNALRTEWKIGSTVIDQDATLGLARLNLQESSEGQDTYRHLLATEVAEIPEKFRSKRSADFNIGAVLAALRAIFRKDYVGWVPVMAKNRLVAVVGESPGGVIIREDGPPKPVVDRPPWSLPRPVGPGQGVRVGIADTALSPAFWLEGGWVARYSDQLWNDQPNWRAGHATFVAGLILHEAPGAIVEARRVLDEQGFGTAWEVARQIAEFGKAGFDILNLSFACYTEDGKAPLAIETAIATLDPDVVVVAAAGNHGLGTDGTVVTEKEVKDGKRPAFPAALPNVIAVGAADELGRPAKFSPTAPWVDVIASGVDVMSTYLTGTIDVTPKDGEPKESAPFNGFATWSGTSFAAALISGRIAAGTQPGRVSARQSWDNMRETLDPSRFGDESDELPRYLQLKPM